MASSILVREIMKKPAPSVSDQVSIADVIDALSRHNVMGLPVVNEFGNIVGFISEQDCIHSMLVSSYHCEGSPSVKEVMRTEVVTVSPETSIVDLAESMNHNRPKQYPVVEDGELVGLVTRKAILKALWENRAHCDAPSKIA
ncbi:CBS domain-containing protein [Spongiibacter sp. KMU-158]|uniref:CBS domain-containing protein n=1 Tax=Spongiibacter pelagi TaxID=2760804 RepID=A0A927GVM9_9GAMM|nr:CBS domain-containing protein [Spongiibacter pelagi]MBD2857569.1 CBS domain-containing protein [Spongiibacter pelagi]